MRDGGSGQDEGVIPPALLTKIFGSAEVPQEGELENILKQIYRPSLFKSPLRARRALSIFKDIPQRTRRAQSP